VEYITSNLNQAPYYLATRFVEGSRELGSMIKGAQPAAFVVRVISQIASALDYLHTGHPTFSPIVHRDVKPQNILVDVAGNAILIDLSVSSHPHYALDDERGLGTPGYMPPEQYNGEEVPATDQFALAMVALHMLIGRGLLPERGTAARKQLEKWRDSQYADVKSQLGKRVHTADVLIKALSFDPANRYESCEVFADRLRWALLQDGEPVHEPVRPAGVPAQPHNDRPSILPWVGVGIATIVALVVLIMALVASPPTPGREPPLAQANPIATTTMAPALPTDPTPKPTAELLPIPIEGMSTLVPAPSQNGSRVTMLQIEPLRESPSTAARVLLRMPEGATAIRTGREQPAGSLIWYEVEFNGQTGWCRNSFCKPVGGTP
jgi:serine/threonine protein kinase